MYWLHYRFLKLLYVSLMCSLDEFVLVKGKSDAYACKKYTQVLFCACYYIGF